MTNRDSARLLEWLISQGFSEEKIVECFNYIADRSNGTGEKKESGSQ